MTISCSLVILRIDLSVYMSGTQVVKTSTRCHRVPEHDALMPKFVENTGDAESVCASSDDESMPFRGGRVRDRKNASTRLIFIACALALAVLGFSYIELRVRYARLDAEFKSSRPELFPGKTSVPVPLI